MEYTKKRVIAVYNPFNGERIVGEYDTQKEAKEHLHLYGRGIYDSAYTKRNEKYVKQK